MQAPDSRSSTASQCEKAIGMLSELEQATRANGYSHAAIQLHHASLAARSALRSIRRVVGAEGWDPRNTGASLTVPIRLEDGRDTGEALFDAGDGLFYSVRLKSPELPELGPIAVSDLGWDLLQSKEAYHLATSNITASLMVVTLAGCGWINTDHGTRWSTSTLGAGTIVRLLRHGRSPPSLAQLPHPLLYRDVVDLVAPLGWRPERGS